MQEEITKIYQRGDMVKCNYAPNESAVGEVVGYEPNGDVRVILSITRKRTKTVDKVETTLKPKLVEDIELLYIDATEDGEESDDDYDDEDDDQEDF